MLQRPTIPKAPQADPALDQQQLYSLGLSYVRDLSRRIWTDHNVHDPGITTLELLSYALTDLSYRASFSVEDLLASGGTGTTPGPLFTAREILPNRPLTSLDYRKLLIDLPRVRNAWIETVDQTLFADPIAGKLYATKPALAGIRDVHVRGLLRAVIDFSDDVKPADRPAVLADVRARLHQNRNLCEDFVDPVGIDTQSFIVCAELVVAPNADVVRIHAEVLFQIEQYFDPPVSNYSLSEMLARSQSDGSAFTVDEIFDGPLLDCGFIDDEELARAELRAEIRLSDVIALIMDIDGVQAVSDIVINPAGTTTPIANKWLVEVAPGKRPTLDRDLSRLVSYKRNMPVWPADADVKTKYKTFADAQRAKRTVVHHDDLPTPAGTGRNPGSYYSFQNHFPALYGIGPDGLPTTAGDARTALSYQLKAYLLFFDQIMANYCAQLARVKDLLSTDPTLDRTYFHQVVDSFANWSSIYDSGAVDAVHTEVEPTDLVHARRNRFLDHLIARFAERFHDYAAVVASLRVTDPSTLIQTKCDFLQSYPSTSSARGMAYDHTLGGANLWDTNNVSGLERRVAKLLGIASYSRRNLDSTADEGMLLIEDILLRMDGFADPRPAICADPDCTDCPLDDPYSYRLHVLLPAYAGRFANMDFRSFTEEVIRQETPAHILPRICWIDQDHMQKVEKAYHEWLQARAAVASDLNTKLGVLLDALDAARNVYPTQTLHPCVPGDATPKFVLGRTRLGTEPRPT
jgi:hypothetical protein